MKTTEYEVTFFNSDGEWQDSDISSTREKATNYAERRLRDTSSFNYATIEKVVKTRVAAVSLKAVVTA